MTAAKQHAIGTHGGSDPRVVIDTSGLPPEYTEFANRLARRIRNLDSAEIGRLSALLENGGKGDGKAS
jgi:hypothetical protein